MASDEFEEATMIEVMELSNNCIKNLNKSLLPLTQLSEINLSYNNLTEFSFTEVKGLKELKLVDLSHNRIYNLSGHSEVILCWRCNYFSYFFDYNNNIIFNFIIHILDYNWTSNWNWAFDVKPQWLGFTRWIIDRHHNA